MRARMLEEACGHRPRPPIDGGSGFQYVRAAVWNQFARDVHTLEGLSHDRGNIKKADLAVKEGGYRRLIGGVHRRRRAASDFQGLSRQTERGKPLEVGLFKSERANRRQIQARGRPMDAARTGHRRWGCACRADLTAPASSRRHIPPCYG